MTKARQTCDDPCNWPVMLVHNHYTEPGGEDQVFSSQAAVLAEYGHEVSLFEETNRRAVSMNALTLGISTIWNQKACDRLAAALKKAKPRVVHFHNTFPLISPAAYRMARRSGAAVVQTLHNFRVICVNGLLFKDGKPCEKCLHTVFPWPGVVNGCYRDSALASTAVACMQIVHRAAGTWQDDVDWYIAPSEFTRGKLTEGGLPAQRISVMSNFLEKDPGIGNGLGRYFLYAGRLSEEKGLPLLIEAWKRVSPKTALRILGTGPLSNWMASEIARMPNVEWHGWQSREHVLSQMKSAAALVYPSECYETGALSIAEGFATGLPAIASNHGTMASMVRHHHNGLLFHPGDARSLASEINWFFDHEDAGLAMRCNARAEFDRNFTKASHYERLMTIYQHAATRAEIQ